MYKYEIEVSRGENAPVQCVPFSSLSKIEDITNILNKGLKFISIDVEIIKVDNIQGIRLLVDDKGSEDLTKVCPKCQMGYCSESYDGCPDCEEKVR